jgi:hypothetical protein
VWEKISCVVLVRKSPKDKIEMMLIDRGCVTGFIWVRIKSTGRLLLIQ